jgi:hypothetical protein
MNGRGRIKHTNGDIYQGEWKNGMPHGQGVYVDTQGSVYKGQWANDLYDGQGIETWDEGNIKYEGQFKAGKKTGKGRFEFDGNYYDGEFLDGQFSGIGTYYFADDGKKYTGQFS